MYLQLKCENNTALRGSIETAGSRIQELAKFPNGTIIAESYRGGTMPGSSNPTEKQISEQNLLP